MGIYVDANPRLRSVKRLMKEGGFTEYEGKAEPGDYVVRYGCNRSRFQNRYPKDVIVLNPKIILDKLTHLRVWMKEGVPVPRSWQSFDEWMALGCPEPILQKMVHSAGGQGITLLSGPDRMRHEDHSVYFQEFIDKDREFRLFLVGNVMAYLMEKERVAGQIAWNIYGGGTGAWRAFGGPNSLKREVLRLGKNALRTIGYDLAALDIVCKDTSLYVLEANSRAELGIKNSGRVARAIMKYANNGGRHVQG